MKMSSQGWKLNRNYDDGPTWQAIRRHATCFVLHVLSFIQHIIRHGLALFCVPCAIIHSTSKCSQFSNKSLHRFGPTTLLDVLPVVVPTEILNDASKIAIIEIEAHLECNLPWTRSLSSHPTSKIKKRNYFAHEYIVVLCKSNYVIWWYYVCPNLRKLKWPSRTLWFPMLFSWSSRHLNIHKWKTYKA